MARYINSIDVYEGRTPSIENFIGSFKRKDDNFCRGDDIPRGILQGLYYNKSVYSKKTNTLYVGKHSSVGNTQKKVRVYEGKGIDESKFIGEYVGLIKLLKKYNHSESYDNSFYTNGGFLYLSNVDRTLVWNTGNSRYIEVYDGDKLIESFNSLNQCFKKYKITASDRKFLNKKGELYSDILKLKFVLRKKECGTEFDEMINEKPYIHGKRIEVYKGNSTDKKDLIKIFKTYVDCCAFYRKNITSYKYKSKDKTYYDKKLNLTFKYF